MRARKHPSYGHSKEAFQITTRHYGGCEHYWYRCKLCGKMAEEATPKASIASLKSRYLENVSPLGTSVKSLPNVRAERQARRAAGACLACGLVICPGSRGELCLARREDLDLPNNWV